MAEGEETQEYGNHALPPYVEESQIEVPSSPERDAGQRGPGEPSAPVVSVQDQFVNSTTIGHGKGKAGFRADTCLVNFNRFPSLIASCTTAFT